ncbi:MAG TPA: hypothetical protein PK033_11060 [Acetivibrio sp.]|nr:hypothetical protein [Acetivibrio sp.]HPT90090.1 hypothetical protein [Acetivibrio sp.]HQA58399.1 hypothetical protein [Acetivibrio sp.]
MSRLEKFRKIRVMRRRCIFVCIFSFLLMFSGILVADKSINELMNREKRPDIVSIMKYKEDYYIKIFNKYILINTEYIKKDIDRFKEWLSDKF